jgi:hypothetical protein
MCVQVTCYSELARAEAFKEILILEKKSSWICELHDHYNIRRRVNKYGEFTFFTDICIHYELINSVLHYCMSGTRNFLIKLAVLSLTVSCKNGCFDDILEFSLFIDSPSYKVILSSSTMNKMVGKTFGAQNVFLFKFVAVSEWGRFYVDVSQYHCDRFKGIPYKEFLEAQKVVAQLTDYESSSSNESDNSPLQN